ncbi:telomerase protein component 1 [Petromyzon marinus]|uniref:telomerase protein component 1 n=1 Tax=Petromyzon marinus TaxID=7757 RepID=UPI003F71D8BF
MGKDKDASHTTAAANAQASRMALDSCSLLSTLGHSITAPGSGRTNSQQQQHGSLWQSSIQTEHNRILVEATAATVRLSLCATDTAARSHRPSALLQPQTRYPAVNIENKILKEYEDSKALKSLKMVRETSGEDRNNTILLRYAGHQITSGSSKGMATSTFPSGALSLTKQKAPSSAGMPWQVPQEGIAQDLAGVGSSENTDDVAPLAGHTWMEQSFTLALEGWGEEDKREEGSPGEDEWAPLLTPAQPVDITLPQKKGLLSVVSVSLVGGLTPDLTEGSTCATLFSIMKELAQTDPEFVLKVALYSRRELGIRKTSNVLLALAAELPPCRPHLVRYFSAAVVLPSDWLDVATTYKSLLGTRERLSLPACLRRALVEKFPAFNEHQLAKYNKEGQKRGLRKEAPPGEAEKHYKYSLKYMIRNLHISKPVHSVMSLLGKRYPGDLATFARSGLPGAFDSRRAGTRMKLAVPETWETQVSLRGNRAEVWEELIDHKKLPFMAMLRNLSNLICAGISPAHHAVVLRTLTSKDSVVRSKQFPFRFFSAYEVLSELEARIQKGEEDVPSLRVMMKNAILKKLRIKSRRNPASASPARGKFDADLYAVCKRARKRLLKKRMAAGCDAELLGRYKEALDHAVRISTSHNVAPLPGRTLVLCNTSAAMNKPCSTGRGLGKSRTVLEVALLLGLMVKFASEHAELVLWGRGSARHVQLADGTVLENLEQLLREEEQRREEEEEDSDDSEAGVDSDDEDDTGLPEELLSTLLLQKKQVTALVVLDWRVKLPPSVRRFLVRYRHSVNPGLLFLHCNLAATSTGVGDPAEGYHESDVFASGYSEQILRFLSERGGERMLRHVEHVDALYGVPAPPDADAGESAVIPAEAPVPLPPAVRWRTVRVFISSTFRDMHGERDLLCRVVLPKLRARAAALLLHLVEVDLRWGVTEEESRHNRQLELCLAEVHRCDYFLGLLGQRYGTVLQEYLVPDEPHFQWVTMYPRGRSVTELEISQCTLHDPGRAFFYFRDSSFISSVPTEWVADFAAESDEAMARQEDLKRRIMESGLPVMERYPCVWGGVAGGMPGVAGLEEFGKAVLHDLWTAISKEAAERGRGDDDGEGGAVSEHERQAAFVAMQASRASARRGPLQEAAAGLRATEAGGAVLVRGASASGKTVLMAQLADLLAQGRSSEEAHGPCAPSDVLPFFSDACGEQPSASSALSYLCTGLRARLGLSGSIPTSQPALASLFKSLLMQAGGTGAERVPVAGAGARRGRPDFVGEAAARRCRKPGLILTVLVDGLDGQLGRSADWLPIPIPPGVRLVVSATLGSSLDKALLRVCSVAQVCVGPLERQEKADLVRRTLASHHKKLDESHSNNQMSLLLAKRESRCPLFLAIACRELRAFGLFSKVSERIKQMPQTVSGLLQEVLARLEDDHGAPTVRAALASLCCSRTGLADEDLRQVVSLCLAAGLWATEPGAPGKRKAAKTVHDPLEFWEKLDALPMSPCNALPMARFSHLIRELRSFAGGSCSSEGSATGHLQLLSQEPALLAVRSRYLHRGDSESLAHTAIAVHLLKKLKPWQDGRVPRVDPDVLAELPYHLVHAGLAVKLGHLLADLRFLYLKIANRTVPQLLEDFDLYATSVAQQGLAPCPDVEGLREFVSQNQHILRRSPRLMWQQAINSAPGSPASVQAVSLAVEASWATRGVTSPRPGFVVEWVNRHHAAPAALRTTGGFTGEPWCLATCVRSDAVIVATGLGHVQLLHIDTGKELQSVSAHSEGISACCFLSENLICLGTSNGQMSTWNIREGYRVLSVQAHRLRVSGCAPSTCGRQVLTVSWDCSLKIWSVTEGRCVAELSSSRPLSCVAVHPLGALAVTGSWDSALVTWDVFHLRRVSTLRGHGAAVRAVAYSPSGKYLASAALDGEVILWSSESGTVLGTYLGHKGPVNCVQFTPDGRYLLTGGDDNKVRVWTGGLGRPVAVLGGPGRDAVPVAVVAALCVSGSPDGSQLAVGLHSGGVRVHGVHSGITVEVQAHPHAVHCVVWLLDAGGTALASGSEGGSVKVWRLSGEEALGDAAALTLNRTLQGLSGAVRALACSDRFLAAASDDAMVVLWPIGEALGGQGEATSAPSGVLWGHEGAVTCCCFSPDGSQLLTGSKDRSLVFWEVQASRARLRVPSSHGDWVTGVHWDRDGETVVSCSNDCTVKVWDASTGHLQRELRGHQSSVNCVSVTDGVILSGSSDGELRAWRCSGQEVACIPAHAQRINGAWVWLQQQQQGAGKRPGEALSEALRAASASDDGTVRIWAPLMGSELASLSEHSGPVQALAVTALSNYALSASKDGSVKMWQLRILPAAASTLPCRHQRAVTAVQASPGGRHVVSGAEDGHVLLWSRCSGPALAPSAAVQAHDGAVSCVCFPERTDETFLTAGMDRQVCCWRILPGDRVEVLCRLHSLEVEVPLVSMAATWEACGEGGGGDGGAVLAGDAAGQALLLSSRPLSITARRTTRSAQWIVGISPSGPDLWQVCGVAGPEEFIIYTLRATQNSLKLVESHTRSLPAGEPGAWLSHAGFVQLQGGPHWACGDSRGNLELWSAARVVAGPHGGGGGSAAGFVSRTQRVHGADVTGVYVVGSVLATASLDHSVKLWSLPDLRQLGVFVCSGPVTCMRTVACGGHEVVVCGDSLGQVYFLRLHDAFF